MRPGVVDPIVNHPNPDRTRKLQALVVDSSTERRDVIRGVLSGMRRIDLVGEVSSVEAAIDCVRHMSPELVIAALQLPMFNGVELARRIHVIRPSTRVIVVSLMSEGIRDAVLDSGSNGFAAFGRIGAELRREIRRLFPGRKPGGSGRARAKARRNRRRRRGARNKT